MPKFIYLSFTMVMVICFSSITTVHALQLKEENSAEEKKVETTQPPKIPKEKVTIPNDDLSSLQKGDYFKVSEEILGSGLIVLYAPWDDLANACTVTEQSVFVIEKNDGKPIFRFFRIYEEYGKINPKETCPDDISFTADITNKEAELSTLEILKKLKISKEEAREKPL